jgi:hypothetical protein
MKMTLKQLLKQYIRDNYADQIRSEDHLQAVVNGVDFYMHEVLIPQTIKDLSEEEVDPR